MEDEIMTRKSLAIYFKVSKKTIKRMETKGLPIIKIGDLTRYDFKKAKKWIEKNGGLL